MWTCRQSGRTTTTARRITATFVKSLYNLAASESELHVFVYAMILLLNSSSWPHLTYIHGAPFRVAVECLCVRTKTNWEGMREG